MLILSRYIAKYEFKPLQRYFSIDNLIDGARKVIKGLGQEITPSKQNKGFRFFKVRIGSHAEGRMIVFVVSQNGKVVPLLIRLKKDKKLGMNMSANNPYVVDQVDKNLGHVIEDIESKDFEEFEI